MWHHILTRIFIYEILEIFVIFVVTLDQHILNSLRLEFCFLFLLGSIHNFLLLIWFKSVLVDGLFVFLKMSKSIFHLLFPYHISLSTRIHEKLLSRLIILILNQIFQSLKITLLIKIHIRNKFLPMVEVLHLFNRWWWREFKNFAFFLFLFLLLFTIIQIYHGHCISFFRMVVRGKRIRYNSTLFFGR